VGCQDQHLLSQKDVSYSSTNGIKGASLFVVALSTLRPTTAWTTSTSRCRDRRYDLPRSLKDDGWPRPAELPRPAYYLQTTAAALQVRRRPAPAGQALRGPATTCQPLRLRLAYLRSRLSALLVATPWVNPCAVAVTNEQCRAWAGCGARLKAAIVLTAIAATSNLLMVLPFFTGMVSLTAYIIQPLPDLLTRRRLGLWLMVTSGEVRPR
jgi:hypothetical protein